ncbi:hypothetical protein LX36DRAFT_189064 [Colletotrichum falcatum]|nr:hypothetical protein LX36DRAFT_189064 [Colletotrichum falcatum]
MIYMPMFASNQIGRCPSLPSRDVPFPVYPQLPGKKASTSHTQKSRPSLYSKKRRDMIVSSLQNQVNPKKSKKKKKKKRQDHPVIPQPQASCAVHAVMKDHTHTWPPLSRTPRVFTRDALPLCPDRCAQLLPCRPAFRMRASKKALMRFARPPPSSPDMCCCLRYKFHPRTPTTQLPVRVDSRKHG